MCVAPSHYKGKGFYAQAHLKTWGVVSRFFPAGFLQTFDRSKVPKKQIPGHVF